MKLEEIVALVLATLASLRMILWLVSPKAHQPVVMDLYNEKGVIAKRIVYLGLFLFLSYLLITTGSIVRYVLAIFAIGSLYDFYFTYVSLPKISVAEFEAIEAKGKYATEMPVLSKVRWFIAIPLLLLTVWLYVFVFVH